MIYFVTVNYYSTDLITQLLKSIQETSHIPYKVVIVNNSSDDPSIFHLKSEFIIILESQTNKGFGQACNLGLNWIYLQNPHAIVWIINPDTYLLEKARDNNILEQVSAFFDIHPEISIVGTAIYTPTGETWFTGGKFIPWQGAILATNLFSAHPEADYVSSSWVTACSMLLNLRKFPQCPQFDPAYFLYYEDFDFCRRYAQQGHLICITNQIAVVHQPSSITDRNVYQKYHHSTYSYLLTLKKYTNYLVFFFRFSRLTMHALFLVLIKPQVARGKLSGICYYLKQVM